MRESVNTGSWVVLAGGGMTAADWVLRATPWDRVEQADGVVAISAGAVAAAFHVYGLPRMPERTIARPEDVRRAIVRRMRHLHGAQRWLPGLADPVETLASIPGYEIGDEWPSWPLQIVVTEVPSRRRVLLDADSGVPLLWAAAASAAIPGIFMPAAFDGRLFVDGGVLSTTGLDLVPEGVSSLLLVDPRGSLPPTPTRRRMQRFAAHQERLAAEAAGRAAGVVSTIVPSPEEAERIWSHPLRFRYTADVGSSRVSEWLYEQIAARVGGWHRAAAERVLSSHR